MRFHFLNKDLLIIRSNRNLCHCPDPMRQFKLADKKKWTKPSQGWNGKVFRSGKWGRGGWEDGSVGKVLALSSQP